MRTLLIALLCLATLPAGEETYADPLNGYAFPAELMTGMKFIGHKVYPQQALGYSVRYEDPANGGVKVDIYLYDSGRTDIGDGVTSKPVVELLGSFGDELQQVVKMGSYQAVRGDETLGKALAAIDAKMLLSAGFEIQYPKGKDGSDGRTMKSLLLLTAINGRIFKVRASYLPSYPLDHAAFGASLVTMVKELRAKR